MIRKIQGKWVVLVGILVSLVSAANAAVPTDMDGVTALGTGYLTQGTTYAVGAAVLGFGWVGYTIAKKFVKGAKST